MALLNNVIFYLDDVLEVSEMSVAITPELETGTDLEVATESDITLIAEDGQKVERMKATMSGGIMTITARGIKKDSSGSDAGLQQRWLAGQRCIMTIFAGTFVIATQNNSFSGDNTFSGDNIYSGLNTYNGGVVFNGPVSLGTVADFNVLGQSNPCPVVASATARDLIYTSPITNDRVYRTDLHAEQIYDSATATWNTQAVGTPTPNASTSVAGIVKIATSSSDPDSTGGIYNLPPLSMISSIVSSSDNGQRSFVLGENLTASAASPKVVSLMPDGKVYGLTGNKRQYTGDLAGYTTTTSCVLNGGDKIATVGISGNILTLFIGTVNRTTRVITRGVGQQITTDSNNCNIVKVAEDKICVMYKNTSNIIFVRSISIIGTVGTISDAVQIYGASAFTGITAYLNLRDNVVFVNIALTTAPSTQHFLITFSGNTPTVVAGAVVGMSNNSGFGCNYCKINDEYFGFYNFDSSGNRFQCLRYTTTITYGTVVSRGRFEGSITSDGISLYIAENSATTKFLMKYSFDTTTCNLTQIYAIDISSDSVPNYLIKYFNGMIAFGRGGTSLIFYSLGATSATKRNTVSYGIPLTWLDKHSDVGNTYLFTAISGNPTTYYEIANENRNIIGLLSSSGNKDDTKTITIDGGISTLSGIVPGENYWAVESTGLLDKGTGLIKFGKGLSTTALKLTINGID